MPARLEVASLQGDGSRHDGEPSGCVSLGVNGAGISGGVSQDNSAGQGESQKLVAVWAECDAENLLGVLQHRTPALALVQVGPEVGNKSC